jgi:hypothetical protein
MGIRLLRPDLVRPFQVLPEIGPIIKKTPWLKVVSACYQGGNGGQNKIKVSRRRICNIFPKQLQLAQRMLVRLRSASGLCTTA